MRLQRDLNQSGAQQRGSVCVSGSISPFEPVDATNPVLVSLIPFQRRWSYSRDHCLR